jgi:hypothetical protein
MGLLPFHFSVLSIYISTPLTTINMGVLINETHFIIKMINKTNN